MRSMCVSSRCGPELPVRAPTGSHAAGHGLTITNLVYVWDVTSDLILMGRSAPRAPGPRRADDRRITMVSVVVAGLFLALAAVAALAGPLAAGPAAPWLPLHLALAGGATTAIAGVMPFFVAALAAGHPASPRVRASAVALIATGALLVACAAWRRPRRGSRASAASCSSPGVVGGRRRHAPGGSRRAHGPPADRQPRLPRGAREPRGRRVARHARGDGRDAGPRTVGDAPARARVGEPRRVRVGRHRRDPAPLPADRARDADRAAPGDGGRRARAGPRRPARRRWRSSSGRRSSRRAGPSSSSSGAVALAAEAVATVRARGRWTTDPGWHLVAEAGLVAGVAWYVVGIALASGRLAASAIGAAPDGWSTPLVAAPLAIGWVVQVLIASWTHLLPSIGPGDPPAHARQRTVLGRWAVPRLAALNLGTALARHRVAGRRRAAGRRSASSSSRPRCSPAWPSARSAIRARASRASAGPAASSAAVVAGPASSASVARAKVDAQRLLPRGEHLVDVARPVDAARPAAQHARPPPACRPRPPRSPRAG